MRTKELAPDTRAALEAAVAAATAEREARSEDVRAAQLAYLRAASDLFGLSIQLDGLKMIDDMAEQAETSAKIQHHAKKAPKRAGSSLRRR